MPWFDVIWNDEKEGNAAHIAEHGLTREDVEHVLQNPVYADISQTTGRPVCFGYVPDGRYICVVYEEVDNCTLYPVTAFAVSEANND